MPADRQLIHVKGLGFVLAAKIGQQNIAPYASIIREAYEGFAMGRFQTQAEVKRFFESFPDFPRNRRGEVAWQRVADILTQPVYTGHICSETYGLSWLPAQHAALITLDLFDKVQARRNGPAYAPARKNIGDDFACRGIVACADCNTPLRSSWPQGKTKRYAYYLCQTKGCVQYGKSIPRDKLEGEVGELIRTLQPTKPMMQLARAMFATAWNQRRCSAPPEFAVSITRLCSRGILSVELRSRISKAVQGSR